MFGKRKWLSEFDSMFNELNFMFNSPTFIQGKSNIEEGSDEYGNWTKETFTSTDGTYSITSIVRVNDSTITSESDKTLELKNKLQKCIENQQFEKAAKLRDQIKNLEDNKKKIDDLQSKLDKAVKKQEFEEAIKLRDQLRELED